MKSTVAQKIWKGQYWGPEGAIADAGAAYDHDPEGELIAFASTLYSAYRTAKKRRDFSKLGKLSELLPDVMRKIKARVMNKLETLTPDQLDVASTTLEWWSRTVSRADLQKNVHIWHYRGALRSAASRACDRGLELTQEEKLGEHTRALLCLTQARLLMGVRTLRAGDFLADAEVRAPHIKDPNQRSRVYRKAAFLRGLLFLRRMNPMDLVRAARAFHDARTTLDISPDVKLKNRILA